jgi:hypothetical protein
MLTPLRLPDGATAFVVCLPLHRRHRRGIYRRPSDWLAQADEFLAWGKTRREALQHLVEISGGHFPIDEASVRRHARHHGYCVIKTRGAEYDRRRQVGAGLYLLVNAVTNVTVLPTATRENIEAFLNARDKAPPEGDGANVIHLAR